LCSWRPVSSLSLSLSSLSLSSRSSSSCAAILRLLDWGTFLMRCVVVDMGALNPNLSEEQVVCSTGWGEVYNERFLTLSLGSWYDNSRLLLIVGGVTEAGLRLVPLSTAQGFAGAWQGHISSKIVKILRWTYNFLPLTHLRRSHWVFFGITGIKLKVIVFPTTSFWCCYRFSSFWSCAAWPPTPWLYLELCRQGAVSPSLALTVECLALFLGGIEQDRQLLWLRQGWDERCRSVS
jgi:hypothetical protein